MDESCAGRKEIRIVKKMNINVRYLKTIISN